MANLGSTTYTSVVWTAGDVITEAKLDNMVANDQAYDSHAAQGLLVNNNKSVAGKNTSATAKNIGMINTSDQLEFGEDSLTAIRKGIWDGWITVAGSWTYASVDGPTGVITVPSGAASIYAVGQRIKLTQTTVKYFIVTAVTDTTLTVYGGTDYTLANAAISLMYYSYAKTPLGFPASPIKWTEVTTSTSNDAQSSPVAGTWYNLGSRSLSIPIGCWFVDYFAWADQNKASATAIDIQSTLSTANNSESDKEFSDGIQQNGASGTLQPGKGLSRMKQLLLAAKTSYYLNAKTTVASSGPLEFRGDVYTTKIRALCAYL